MTEYNRMGWEHLLKLTSLSISQMLDEIHSIGITVCQSNFVLWRQYGTIPPQDLVRICNHFQYSITNFSRIAGQENVATSNRIIPQAEWHDIILTPNNLVDYATNVNKRKRDDAIRRIGCSAGYYDAFRKYPAVSLPQKLTYTSLLAYINNAGMYPGDVIMDTNGPFPLEYGVHPFYDHAAINAYSQQFPASRVSYVAEEIIDTKEFLLQYVTKGHLEGDGHIIAISMEALNEIASIITNLRSENEDLRNHIRELREAYQPGSTV